MRVALAIPAAGSPGTLATSAFTGALDEGLLTVGIETRVVGLTLDPAEWRPNVLGELESVAPWLPPTRLGLADRRDAVDKGILGSSACPHRRCHGSWRLEVLLERALHEFWAEPDLEDVVLADTRSLPLLRTVCRTAHRMGVKVIVVANEALTNTQIDPGMRDDYVRCVADCASGVWAVSHHLASYWESAGIPSEHIFIQPSLVRPSSFIEFKSAAVPHRALYLGNLAHREIEYLLDVADIVSARLSDFELEIYGDAPLEIRSRLESVVAARGLVGVVSVNPPVAPTEVPALLASAGALLLPRSLGEFSTAGFPNKLGEYLASGRPVVATGVGDIPHYLTDGQHAIIVEPDDIAAFSTAVLEVFDSPERSANVGTAGKSLAAELLSADRVAQRLVSFIGSLPPNRARPPGGARIPLGLRIASYAPDPALIRRDIVRIVRAIRHRGSTPDSHCP